MNTSPRAALIACAIVATGAIAIPAVASLSTDATQSPTAAAAEFGSVPSLFVPIEHFRAADSRTNGSKLVVGGDESETIRFIDLARRDGDEFGTRVIPAGTTAVSFNLTVAQTEGRGFVHMDSPVAERGESSTLNWTADGQTVTNSGVTIVGTTDAEAVLLAGVSIGGGDGAAAHIIIDVTGYYVPAGTP